MAKRLCVTSVAKIERDELFFENEIHRVVVEKRRDRVFFVCVEFSVSKRLHQTRFARLFVAHKQTLYVYDFHLYVRILSRSV